MKNPLVMLSLSLILSAGSAFGAVIRDPIKTDLDLKEKIAPENSYTLNANISFSINKMLSIKAFTKPITLSISCDGTVLAKDNLLFENRMIGKSFTKAVTVNALEILCPELNPVLNLEPNGMELDIEEGGISYHLANNGPSTSGLIAKIKDQLETKKTELIKTHSLMASVSHSKESLFCLIEAYRNDVMTTGVITELESQYKLLFGDLLGSGINCNQTATLGPKVEQCRLGNDSLSLFCVVWTKYESVRTWYQTAISDLSEKDSALSIEDEQYRSEIARLIAILNDDSSPSKAQTD